MLIRVICPHFAPDVAPTGEVMGSIVAELVERGHRVDVITALPWYRGHAIDAGWDHRLSQREETEWGSITRLHPFPTDKSNIWARLVGFGGFTALATWSGMRGRRPDVVLAMSPPLLIGFAGWLAARRWRAPFVFNIQDVFPDVAVEVGAITNPKIIAAARAVERFLYLRSDAVTVLSADLSDNLAAKIGATASSRLAVIPNFVDTERIVPGDAMNAYRTEFGLGDRVVVMYAGNLGYSQSVDLLIDAARRFAGDDRVVFVINGSGSRRHELQRCAEGLDNVVFVDLQPRERVAEVLAAADIHTVLLGKGLARSSVPSKLYSILAAARPVVASVDAGTEVERVLTESGGGVAAEPDDADGFAALLDPLIDDATRRATMGRAGREWVEQWVSPAAVAEQYEQLFERLSVRHR